MKSITIKLNDDLLDDTNKAIEYFNTEEQHCKNVMTKSSVLRAALIGLVKKYKKLCQ